MKTAFISPFSNPSNSYIEIQKRILLECGYQVRPLTLRTIFSPDLPTLLSRDSTLIFHWIENRCFSHGKNNPRFSLIGFLIWATYFLITKLTRGESVYFIHNHAVHDTTGINRTISKMLISAFGSICTKRATHSPPLAKFYRAHYLPHPLYWDSKTPTSEQCQGSQDRSGPLHFGIIGAIRPYKGIDRIISNWPKGHHLKISGQCSDGYLNTLKNLVKQFDLEDSVTIDARFLSDADLRQALDETDALLLPHNPESSLVSGMFFEAIGKAPIIIARPTPFIEWAANQTKCVLLLSSDESLPDIVAQACALNEDSTGLESRAFALREFGWNKCCERYKLFYRTEAITRREHT